jgi:hypothetical protein
MMKPEQSARNNLVMEFNHDHAVVNRGGRTFLIWWSCVVALQAIIFIEPIGLLCALIAIIAGTLGVTISLDINRLKCFPVSTFIILGYTTYYFLLPPIVTLIEFKPLIYNLVHPALIFTHSSICLIAILFAYFIYTSSRVSQIIRHFISEAIYRPLGFFTPVSDMRLYAMGTIGIIALISQVFFANNAQQEALGLENKFLQSLSSLSFLPFVVFIRSLFDPTSKPKTILLLPFFIYIIILFLVSIGSNTRTPLFLGLASLALGYFYALAIQRISTKVFNARNVVLLIFGGWVLVGPITDLATAIPAVREHRSNISPVDLISETISVYFDKDALREYKKLSMIENREWDELFVENLFFARLANLKYADQSIDLALSLDDASGAYLRSVDVQRALAQFPRPLIEFFGLPVDKAFVGSASGGDFMLFAATGNPAVLGGFRTGSLFGSGYAEFGWFYPIILMILVFISLPLIDAQTSRILVSVPSSESSVIPIFNPLCIVGLFSWFFYLTSAATGSDSFSVLTGIVLRGWIQTIIVYTFAYGATSFFAGFSDNSKR